MLLNLSTIAVRRACALWQPSLPPRFSQQRILGAGFRHGAFGILPHLIGFVVVTCLIFWTCRAVRKRFGQVCDLRRWGILLEIFSRNADSPGYRGLLGGSAGYARGAALHVLRHEYPMLARSGRCAYACFQRGSNAILLSASSSGRTGRAEIGYGNYACRWLAAGKFESLIAGTTSNEATHAALPPSPLLRSRWS